MTRLRVLIAVLFAIVLLATATAAPALGGGGAKPTCQAGSCGG